MTSNHPHKPLRIWRALPLLAMIAPAAIAETPPGTISTKAENACFAARSFLTNEADWKAKWDAATETTPQFSTINRLNLGAKATLVILFSCPELVEEKAKVECDLKMTRADGSSVFQQGGLPCFDGTLSRPREAEHLAEIWLDFDVTPEDGTGPVDIRIGLTDRNLGERLQMTLPIEFTGKEPE